ncbi:hypothetical protein SAVIM338S_00496 [Streptomyces avidinii]
MPNHEDEAGRTPEPVLTTEDLAHPAAARGDAAVFPGEATGERDRRDDPAQFAEGGSGADPEGVWEPDATSGPGRDGAWQEPERDASLGREPVPQPDGDTGQDEGSLLGAAEAERYRTTWNEIQGRFVDEPREAVRAADTLVAEVMQTFAGALAEHRSGLEKQWDHGEEVATEDLRQALRAYRSLVNRLLDT